MHNFIIAAFVRSKAEYNRRAAIIEALRAGRLPSKIIMFFGYSLLTMHDIVQNYTALEKSEEDFANQARKIHSKEKMVRTPPVVQRAQELI